MTSLTASDLSRIAVSALGALTVSAACVLGAVGPAKAAVPATVPAWAAQVERVIDGAQPDVNDRFVPAAAGAATVAVHFTADGGYAGATLVRSTGSDPLDRRAVAFARSLHYPRLPEAVRGQPRDVTMRLAFGAARRDTVGGRAVPAGLQLAAR